MQAQDIVIKSADKGGRIVILNKSDYVGGANRLLSYNTTYAKLNRGPKADFAKEADSLISTALKDVIISKTETFIRYHIFTTFPRSTRI